MYNNLFFGDMICKRSKKKFRLMPMLQPEYVAQEIVSGILLNQVVVVLPGSVRFLLPLKW